MIIANASLAKVAQYPQPQTLNPKPQNAKPFGPGPVVHADDDDVLFLGQLPCIVDALLVLVADLRDHQGFGVWGLAFRVEAFGSRFVVNPRKLEPGLRMISAGITYFMSEEHEENEVVPSVWFLL